MAGRKPVRIQTVAATDAHGLELAERLRAADRDEVLASSGDVSLVDVILDGLRKSAEAWATLFDGRLACVWGVVPMSDDLVGGRIGCGWLLTTQEVERHPKALWKASLAALPALLDRWDELVNAIDVRHLQALRWAVRLGFRLEAPAPFGAAGRDFCRFTVSKEDLRCATRL